MTITSPHIFESRKTRTILAVRLGPSVDLMRLCIVAVCIIANALAQTIPFTQIPGQLNLGNRATTLISIVDQTLIIANATTAETATFLGLSGNGTVLFRTDLNISLGDNLAHYYSNDSVCFLGSNSPSGGSPFTVQLACCSSTECALGPAYNVTSALSSLSPTYAVALSGTANGYTFASYANIDTEAGATVAELTVASSSAGLSVFDMPVKMNFTTPVIAGVDAFYVTVTDDGAAIIVAFDKSSRNLYFSDQLDINSLSAAALSNGLANVLALSECNSESSLHGGLGHVSMGFYVFVDCQSPTTSTFVLRWPLGSPFSELTASTRINSPSPFVESTMLFYNDQAYLLSLSEPSFATSEVGLAPLNTSTITLLAPSAIVFEINTTTNVALDFSPASLFNNIMAYRPVNASSDNEIEVAAWNRQNSTFSRRNVTLEPDIIAIITVTMNRQSSCGLVLEGPNKTYNAYVALASKSGSTTLLVSSWYLVLIVTFSLYLAN